MTTNSKTGVSSASRGGEVIFLRAERYVIRWRKSSATYVIYHSGRVFESGFDTEQAAEQYLQDKFERDERVGGAQ